jgi:hypothetical protein
MQNMRSRNQICGKLLDDYKSHSYVRSQMYNFIISEVIQNCFSVKETA